MNRTNENGQEDAFEKKMASFRLSAPPEGWREGLISNAIPVEEFKEKTFLARIRFSLPDRILGSGLAAAWLLILGFNLATPSDPVAEEVALQAEAFTGLRPPLLAGRFGGLGSD